MGEELMGTGWVAREGIGGWGRFVFQMIQQ